jgi:hypothetical protein
MVLLNNGQVKKELVIESSQFVLVITASDKTVHTLVIDRVEDAESLVQNYLDLNGYAWCQSFVLNAQAQQVAYISNSGILYPGDRNYQTWERNFCLIGRLLDLVTGKRVCSPSDLLILESRGYSEYEGRTECLRDVPTIDLLCGDFDEAVAFSKVYLEKHQLGKRDWAGGYVFERTNGKCAAYVSYSGEVLTPGDPGWTDPHLVDSPLQPLYLLMHQTQVV